MKLRSRRLLREAKPTIPNPLIISIQTFGSGTATMAGAGSAEKFPELVERKVRSDLYQSA